ncbi:heavy metal translocating P-type ATPase [Vibrio sp. TH_r3]|uniref:heavy metal translocating P-type ATPase n=1 Tax=Vibrio sp. TH_r3 TaxID=3082084 RepID=UPI002953989D|nr:heavy metal translocating P-type ATPase [Vibrio sp. TH_r3]MDV7104086.1 heavy metal translocating P-type ATPase [Vibrio sp. TH_r3]
MNQFVIPLKGLNCGKCVKKVTDSLTPFSETKIHSIDKTSLSVETSQPLTTIISAIESLQYQAGNHISLTLFGLKCNKCVNKVAEALDNNNQIARFDVLIDSLTVVTTLNALSIIDIIEKLGFSATINNSESPQATPHPLSESNTCDKSNSSQSEASSDFKQATLNKNNRPSLHTLNLSLQGMTCASCVSSVEKACLKVAGVINAQINLAEQSAIISAQTNDNVIQDKLIYSIEQAGYNASIIEDEATLQQELQAGHLHAQTTHKKNATLALALGIPLMLWGLFGGNMMIRNGSDQLSWGLIGIICLLLLATAGKHFYINAWQSLIHKRATMDTLVALGTGAAWFYSMLVVFFPNWFPVASRHIYFEASTMIIGLISLGHYIEAKAKQKTTQSLQSLIGLQAKFATVRTDHGEVQMPIEAIHKGMYILIKPGEKVPVDGQVLEGESYVDESMLTGEPIPNLKISGDKISAGTINNDGSLLMLATGVGNETMVSRIIQLVRLAQSSKPAIAKLADSISAVFVPIVICIALTAALIWWWFGPEPKASFMLIVSTTVLIIACPCALGLATPLSITVGIGKAAELGILIRDADVLQHTSKINTVVFDKTGTLTLGKPSVTEFETFNGIEKDIFLQSIYALESHSEHPLASAICHFAKEQYKENAIEDRPNYTEDRPIQLATASNVQNVKGKGITGQVGGLDIAIGSISFIRSKGISIPDKSVNRYLTKARSVACVSLGQQLVGIIAISDPIKKDSAQAISNLKAKGIDVILLSGDHKTVAEKIAKEVGIEKTIANVLPDEKAKHIKKLQSEGRKVAMIGDGINDAPALAQADIGMAMGSGSDVAIESAQMTLLTSSPLAVNNAIELSKATVVNIKQNLLGAFIYNLIGIPVAAGILYPAFGFLLSPVFAGAAMALSSITVVSNANRLRFFKVH